MTDSTDLFVVAVAAIIKKRGQILAMKRSLKKKAGPGLWETLSGRVQHGEEPEHAVMREIQEECGLTVKLNPNPIDLYMATRRNTPMLLIVYEADYISGDVIMSDEHSEYSWLSADAFDELTTLKRLVKAVRKSLALEIKVGL